MTHLALQRESSQELWTSVNPALSIGQLLQTLEVIHCAIGFVPSSPPQVILQLSGRFFNLFAVLASVPQSRESFGFPLLLFAWTSAETTRSIFYALNLYFTVPYGIIWLRYTVFIIAFPLGLVGELLAMFAAVPHVKRHPPPFLLKLSAPANVAILCDVISYSMLFVFLAAFFNLYSYMFRQRRKVLSPSSRTLSQTKGKKKAWPSYSNHLQISDVQVINK